MRDVSTVHSEARRLIPPPKKRGLGSPNSLTIAGLRIVVVYISYPWPPE